MNKKTLIIVAVAVVVVLAAVLGVVLLGGSNKGTTTTPTTTTTTTTTTTNNGGNPTPTEENYTLGMGVVFSEEKNSELGATVATVVLDADGKIVLCRIDAVQNKFEIDFDNEEISFTELRTKFEQKFDYHMAAYGQSMDNNGDGIVKEWFEQIQAFENYVVGMTAEEVAAIPQKTLGAEYGSTAGYIIADDDALLSAGCTIQIQQFMDAVVKACNDEFAVGFTAVKDTFTLGVAANSADNHTNPSTFDDNGAVISMDIDFAASVVVDGEIVASLNDAIQPKVLVDWDNNVTGTEDQRTKREKKEDYGMGGKPYSPDHNGDGIVKEWYEQSAAFSEYVIGMTAEEVADMPTKVFEADGYIISADDALLSAGCTIQISGIKAVVAESVTNAR